MKSRVKFAILILVILSAAGDAAAESPFQIGPVPGLTTAWHPAPAVTSVPLGSKLTFKRQQRWGVSISWRGATQVSSDRYWSVAEYHADTTGRHVVTVEYLKADGELVAEHCALDVVDFAAEQIRFSAVEASVDPVVLDSDDLNASTFDYFAGGSIAGLRRVSGNHYRTSVGRWIHLEIEIEPAGFAPLIEWRYTSQEPTLGTSRKLRFSQPAVHSISVGPTADPWEVLLETYQVEITSHVSNQTVIPTDVPVTFTAVTDPRGFEEEITWLASTKYGSCDPVMGQGAEFTVRFEDAWGSDERTREPFQWLGVKADHVVFNQDQKKKPLSLETACSECGGCESGNCGGQDSAGDAVYLFSGEFYESAVDLQIRGRGQAFVWARKYRSRLGPDTAQGNGWDSSYNIRIESSGADLVLFDGNTRQDTYSQSGGVWTAAEFYRELSQNPDGSHTLTFPDTTTWNFNLLDGSPQQGKIRSIVDRNGNTLRFQYDAQGRLTTITDTLDRDIQVAYNADGFIESVTDFAGRQVRYEYYQNGDAGGSFGDLKSVTRPSVVGTPTGNDFPDGKTTTYTYTTGFSDDDLNHNLTTITDPKGQTYLTNVYSEATHPADINYDAVMRQIWGDPDDIIDFVYLGQTPSDSNNFANCKTIVNDRVGNVKEYFFDGNRNVMQREYTGRANPAQPTTETDNRPTGQLRAGDPPFFETQWEYNADARATRMVDPNGNVATSTYDDDNASRRSHGNVTQSCRTAGPLGGDQVMICESFEYDDGFGGCCGTNFVTQHVDGRGNATMHEYDDAGNRLHTQHRIPSIVEDFEYNEFGQMTAHILPDNGNGHRRRDEYTYYTSGLQRGYRESEIVDAPGFALSTTYVYDLVGNVISVTDPEGHDVQYVVNELDQVVRTLSAEVDLPGGVVRYERDTFYDANDNVVRMDVQNIDEAGNLLANSHFTDVYEYEILNFKIRSCREVRDFTEAIPAPPELPTCEGLPDEDFLRMEYEYDGNRNRTLSRNGEAVEGRQPTNVVRTLYDERDLVFREIRAEGDPDQSTTQYDYDLNRNQVRTTQGTQGAAPRVTETAYDGYDRVVRTTDPMGNVASVHYDANHNRIGARMDGELVDTAPTGLGNVRLSETYYFYDELDRLVEQRVAYFDTETGTPILDGNARTLTAWSDNSQVVSVTNDNGHVTRTTYDTANRRAVGADHLDNQMIYLYDRDSLVVETTDLERSGLGGADEEFVTINAYDAMHRLIETVDNSGNTHRFGYDSRDNRTLLRDALDNETRITYDGINRLLATIRDLDDDGADGDGGDITTRQEWDDTSRPVAQIDDNGNRTEYVYDALDRMTSEVYADATVYRYVFDVHHNRIEMEDANGSVVESEYDRLNRLIARDVTTHGTGVSTDLAREDYRYDGLSRLILAEDEDATVTRSYDSLSRVTRETLNGETTTSLYDGVGNEIESTYPGGHIITTTYDELERKKRIADASGMITEYDYIGPGRVERREYGNGTRTDYTYDGISGVPNPPNDFGVKRIIGTRHTRIGDGTVIDDRTYTWDRMYNKTQRKDARVGGPQITHNYEYDDSYRLVHTVATDPLGTVLRDQTYGLDGVGNRTQVDGGHEPGQYTMDPSTPQPADRQMNQYTTTSFDARPYDQNGNLVGIDPRLATERQIAYDYRNQMVEYVDLENGETHTYRYDALGRRITKVVDANGIGNNPTETRYFYDGWQVCEEQDAAGATQATYVYGLYIDEVLNMQRGGVDYYYHTDDLYNVMTVTDATGTAIERYEYADYGQPVDPTNLMVPIVGDLSAIGNPYLFTGRRYDPETDWLYYRTRYLDPLAGRFTTRDQIGIWGDSFNRGNAYSYVGNNPLTRLDALGLLCCPCDIWLNTSIATKYGFVAITSGNLDKPGEWNAKAPGRGVANTHQVIVELDPKEKSNDSADCIPSRAAGGTWVAGGREILSLGGGYLAGFGPDGPASHEVKRPNKSLLVVADSPGFPTIAAGDFPATVDALFRVQIRDRKRSNRLVAYIYYAVHINKTGAGNVPNARNISYEVLKSPKGPCPGGHVKDAPK